MTCDYEAIAKENIIRYGTDIDDYGKKLFVDRYAERTHFIFELLQNTEDALSRLPEDALNHLPEEEASRLRVVSFVLEDNAFRVSHRGDPFNENDVRGICSIGKSTKKNNEIGRFGIGFKSVYAFTERPEIHSGSENFAIESFVRPIAVQPISDCDADKTVILIPFKSGDNQACDDIADRLKRLGVYEFLFLRQIEEIDWKVKDSASGQYLRELKDVDSDVREVTIIGKQEGESEIYEKWLVFSHPVVHNDGSQARPVEIAFSYVQDKGASTYQIRRVDRCSPLVVFFPTDRETYLCFLIQGPYETTPSRDNIKDNEWNKKLVELTASLLKKSLCWLRENKSLDTEALQCLPFKREEFDGTIFEPIFERTKEAFLSSEPLLPCFGGGYIASKHALLSRGSDLCDLFSTAQLSELYEEKKVWLNPDITKDSQPDLHTYLKDELKVKVIDTEDIMRQLNEEFLKAQEDDWIQNLYEFLNKLHGRELRQVVTNRPLIRLEDGSHVKAKGKDDKPLAFLPTEYETRFPTVRRSVCKTEPALQFLKSLGLHEPALVDSIIEHVLPTYQKDKIDDISPENYDKDISDILSAFVGTDSIEQRNRLIDNLKKSKFVKSVDTGNGSQCYETPEKVYLATDRLKSLFQGVYGILLVDDSQPSLQGDNKGDNISDLLEKCGASESLIPIKYVSPIYLWPLMEKANKLDWTLKGLKELLTILPKFDKEKRKDTARRLWDALADLESHAKRIFDAYLNVRSEEFTQKPDDKEAIKESIYIFPNDRSIFKSLFWQHDRRRRRNDASESGDATFVKQLKEMPWVPDANGELQCPKSVPFDSLGWKTNPFLEKVILFKQKQFDIVDVLAQKSGINPELLKVLGEEEYKDLTPEELRSWLESRKRSANPENLASSNGSETSQPISTSRDRGENNGRTEASQSHARTDLLSGHHDEKERDLGGYDHEKRTDIPTNESCKSRPENSNLSASKESREGKITGSDTNLPDRTGHDNSEDRGENNDKTEAMRRSPASFKPYIAVYPDEEESDPDGLTHEQKMKIEERAIDFILKNEPKWKPTPPNQEGYDLFTDEGGNPVFCEVKGKTGSLDDSPVRMSHTQFNLARKQRQSYWLYVVEHANDDHRAKIIRINDPAGKVRTFTFNHSWLRLSEEAIDSGQPRDDTQYD